MKTATAFAAVALTGTVLVAIPPSASATPSASTHSASVALTRSVATTKAPHLDSALIRAAKSTDHTVVVGKVKIKPLVTPDATVWTSPKRGAAVSLVWAVRDADSTAERVRICRQDPLSTSGCVILPLRPTRQSRAGVTIRKSPIGWQVQLVAGYDARSPRECQIDGVRPTRAKVNIAVLGSDQRRVLATDEESWRIRCARK